MNHLVITVLVSWIPVAILQQCNETLTPEQECNETLIRQQRIRKIGDTILLKLGMMEPPANPTLPVVPSAEMMAEYEAVEATLPLQHSAESTLSSQQQCPSQLSPTAKTADLINATSVSEVPSRLEDFCIDLPPCDDPVKKRQNVESSAGGCSWMNIPSLSYKFVFPLNLTNRVLVSLDLVTFKMPPPAFGDKRPPNFRGSEWVEINLLYPFPCRSDLGCTKAGSQIHEVITGKPVTSQVEGFEIFNVTRAVQRWMKHLELVEPVGDLELEIHIRPPVAQYCNDRPFPPSLGFNSTQTHLLMFFRTPNQITHQQRKRQAGSTPVNRDFCFNNPNVTNCCIKELVVNFADDLGWSWILMPPVFAPNYCFGLCPYTWPAATNSTSIFQLYHELNPTSAVEPCCATHSLRSLPILAVLDGIITTTSIPDIIIESCICK